MLSGTPKHLFAARSAGSRTVSFAVALMMSSLCLASSACQHTFCDDFPRTISQADFTISDVQDATIRPEELEKLKLSVDRCAVGIDPKYTPENLRFGTVLSHDGRTYLMFVPLYVTDIYLLFEVDAKASKISNAYQFGVSLPTK
ncbi:hypothetical protein WBP06_14870 [Novosphingobium sp. BL-8H]|uniref:hypothetical protein n=1 Tax=Novosphingobium sp. BL-8H TaxID=3127640 RepID=UPI00375776C5